jgi:hypothetical protein
MHLKLWQCLLFLVRHICGLAEHPAPVANVTDRNIWPQSRGASGRCSALKQHPSAANCQLPPHVRRRHPVGSLWCRMACGRSSTGFQTGANMNCACITSLMLSCFLQARQRHAAWAFLLLIGVVARAFVHVSRFQLAGCTALLSYRRTLEA